MGHSHNCRHWVSSTLVTKDASAKGEPNDLLIPGHCRQAQRSSLLKHVLIPWYPAGQRFANQRRWYDYGQTFVLSTRVRQHSPCQYNSTARADSTRNPCMGKYTIMYNLQCTRTCACRSYYSHYRHQTRPITSALSPFQRVSQCCWSRLLVCFWIWGLQKKVYSAALMKSGQVSHVCALHPFPSQCRYMYIVMGGSTAPGVVLTPDFT